MKQEPTLEKEVDRLDKNLKIAVIIIAILILVIGIFFFGKPQFDKYVSQKQLEAAQQAIAVIIQTIQQQGYIQLGTEDNQIILVEYQGEIQ